MYSYLKASDDGILNSKNFSEISRSEMTSYILDKLIKTGFHIKMMKVDSSKWTYLSVLNKII